MRMQVGIQKFSYKFFETLCICNRFFYKHLVLTWLNNSRLWRNLSRTPSYQVNDIYLPSPIDNVTNHIFLAFQFSSEVVLFMFYISLYVLAVRSAKFIALKNWIVAAADDTFIRVYNYNTLEKVKEFEAHKDYIRCVAVHPTLPYVLTASDDTVIKLWDWEKDWICTKIFEGHSHYVMQVAFNPKDNLNFASASLDGTIKVL